MGHCDKKAFANEALPFGTVLTLAATGSEMNAGSVITNWETNEKYGWGSPVTFPQFSICIQRIQLLYQEIKRFMVWLILCHMY